MRITPMLLLAVGAVLIGLGQLALLPAFEGFDEPSHFSGIEQVAETATIPLYQRSMLSREVMDYHKTGPAPYSSSRPPFTGYGGMTYREFFASPEREKRYVLLYRESPQPPYRPGTEFNYEAQHPPLYYVVMAPLAKLTDSLPLISQLFILRLASFLLACAGIAIGLYGSLAHNPAPQAERQMKAGFLLYPLIVPMFYPEFARLGNDSLCVLLIGIIWALLLRWLGDEKNAKLPVSIGMCFGLGMLTKVFFMPVLSGLVLFLLLRMWQARAARAVLHMRLLGLSLLLIASFLCGGWWYIVRLVADGSLVGYEYLRLQQGGGLLHMLSDKLTPSLFLQGIAGIIASWHWAGTWSLVHVAGWLRLPALALCGWLLIQYLREAWRHNIGDPVWLPLWLGAPFIAGLVHHNLIMVALDGVNSPAGWYFNVLTPVVAFAFALGMSRIVNRPGGHILLSALLLFDLAFLVIVTWSQAALFAGCATKDPGKYYVFDSAPACLGKISEVMANLDILVWPLPAAVAFCAGAACCLAGIVRMRRLPVLTA